MTVAVAVGFAVTACSETPVATSPPPTTAGAEIVVAATEWRFLPARVSVEAGSEVEIALRNDGTVDHNWTVMRRPIETEAQYDAQDALVTISAVPGAVERADVLIPEPGEYQVVCTIPGHLAAGMEGTLVVGP